MSQANPNDHQGQRISDTHKETRMHSRVEEGEENQHGAQSSTHVTPATRLYRHALESILRMLTLADLSRALAVSREWSAAVRSMKPIDGKIEREHSGGFFEQVRPLPPIASIVESPLVRHLAAIHIQRGGGPALDNASLGLLAQHAPNLTSLCCEIKLTPGEALILPATLTSADLRLGGQPTGAAINAVLTALISLPSLSCLRLALGNDNSGVDLRILAACRSLTDLELTGVIGPPSLNGTQIERIRSSLGHLHRFSVGWMNSDDLARFLQPPVTVRWRDIGCVGVTTRTGELLTRLPTLTKLVLAYQRGSAPVDFLPQLSCLTVLHLNTELPSAWGEPQAFAIPADAVLASLVPCNDLTELDLHCGFTSAHWSALFAKLTRIKKLTMTEGALESLECFAAGPITESLEELIIREVTHSAAHPFEMPASELSHLYNLRRLRILDLSGCFASQLAPIAMAKLSPPTPVLPALTTLNVRGRDAPNQFASAKPQGLSFQL